MGTALDAQVVEPTRLRYWKEAETRMGMDAELRVEGWLLQFVRHQKAGSKTFTFFRVPEQEATAICIGVNRYETAPKRQSGSSTSAQSCPPLMG